jgi:hypothetical protein
MNKKINKESGVAVIMALGFMAIILVLVLSFIDISIINRKISENYSYLQTARMAAQTSYQRALAIIDGYRGDSSKDMMQLFSYNSNVNTRSDEMSNLIETVVNGVAYYSSYDSNVGPHWQYLPVDHDTDTPITARLAYAVIVDIGKIDPSSAVDSGSNANSYSKNAVAEWVSETNTGTASNGSYIVGRPGRDLSEMYLTSLPSWFTSSYARDMGATNAAPAGKLTVGSKWDSFDTIFTQLGIADDTTKDSIRNVFVLNNLPDAEAFWVDNGDLQRESSELYHRFNLARTDWEQLEVDSILSTPIAFNEGTSPSDVYSIYWLKNWEDNGAYSTAENCSKQIAANLIDYCDSDDSATTDSVTVPSYVGLEKVPYINEIKLLIQSKILEQDQTPLDGLDDVPPYNYQAMVKVNQIDLELANMYDVLKNVTAEITLELNYDWSYIGSNGTFASGTVTSFSEPISTVSLDINAAAKTYTIGNISTTPTGLNFSSEWTNMADESATHATDLKIENFEITSLKIKLLDTADSSFYDYSFILNTPTDFDDLSTDGNDFFFYFDAQTSDPRQNLMTSDWTYETDTNIDGSTSSIGTLISPYINNNANPQDGSDTEITSNPLNVSTAYIRNAPMQSPWEIGLIHRGSDWETINLKKYRNVSPVGTGGGSSYASGDANILDQIKMSFDNSVYGKINLNTNLEEALEVLLKKICVGSSIENPGEITIAEIPSDQLVDSVLLNNGINGGNLFYTRSQVVRDTNGVPSLYNNSLGLTQTTDATQEEIIGKFINLTKAAYPDFYTIIVIAQAIKDIGIIGTYEVGVDEVLATQKVLTTIQWDENEQEFRIVKYEYLDD